jgi:hypothetical protein
MPHSRAADYQCLLPLETAGLTQKKKNSELFNNKKMNEGDIKKNCQGA